MNEPNESHPEWSKSNEAHTEWSIPVNETVHGSEEDDFERTKNSISI